MGLLSVYLDSYLGKHLRACLGYGIPKGYLGGYIKLTCEAKDFLVMRTTKNYLGLIHSAKGGYIGFT
jgi:hypothetical protein